MVQELMCGHRWGLVMMSWVRVAAELGGAEMLGWRDNMARLGLPLARSGPHARIAELPDPRTGPHPGRRPTRGAA